MLAAFAAVCGSFFRYCSLRQSLEAEAFCAKFILVKKSKGAKLSQKEFNPTSELDRTRDREWESFHSTASLPVPCKSWCLRMSPYHLSGYLLATLPFQSSKADGLSLPCILLDIMLHADLFGYTVTNLSWTSTILFFQDTQKVHCDCFCFLLIGRSCSSIRPCSMSTGSVPRHVCHVVLELRQFRQQFTVGELLTDANFRSAN